VKGRVRDLVLADLAGCLVLLAALAAGWRDAAVFGLAVLIILNLLVILRERSARFDKESEE
jgi:hypothetical protein